MYIALEGLKGSGKSTLIERLEKEFLKKEKIEYSLMKQTLKDDKYSLIEKMFAKYSFLNNNSFFRAIVYARRAYVATKKTNWNSQLILGDRSIITSYITRWRKWFNSPKLTVLFVNIMEPFMHSPDVIIFLQVSIENLIRRMEKRGIFDIDSSVERLKTMDNAYSEIGTYKIKKTRQIKWIYVDGNKTEDEVFDETCKIIRDCLDKK